MDPLVIVVALLAVVVAGNVLVTGAVIRRLADHERRLAAGPGLAPPGGLAPGEAVPPVGAHTLAGGHVDAARLAAVAFFSAHCEACATHAPEFAAVVGERGLPAAAVVTGEGEGADVLLERLGPVPVVREPELGGTFAGAFRVDTFPTYFAIEEGHVVAPAVSAGELGELLDKIRRTAP
jgi:hypothetical protein